MADSTVNLPGPLGSLPIKATDNGDGTWSLQVSTVGGDSTVQDLTITGDLNHDGTKVGLFGVAPATRTTGVANLDLTALAGAANDTLEALPDPADTPITADALRDDIVTNLLPALRNDIADVATKLNVVMTALKSLGIIGA